jgi:hypothetical protein
MGFLCSILAKTGGGGPIQVPALRAFVRLGDPFPESNAEIESALAASASRSAWSLNSETNDFHSGLRSQQCLSALAIYRVMVTCITHSQRTVDGQCQSSGKKCQAVAEVLGR